MRVLILNTGKPLKELIEVFEYENIAYHIENIEHLYVLESDNLKGNFRLFTEYLSISNERNVLRDFDIVAFFQQDNLFEIFSFRLFVYGIHRGMNEINCNKEIVFLGSNIKRYSNDKEFHHSINKTSLSKNYSITINYV